MLKSKCFLKRKIIQTCFDNNYNDEIRKHNFTFSKNQYITICTFTYVDV